MSVTYLYMYLHACLLIHEQVIDLQFSVTGLEFMNYCIIFCVNVVLHSTICQPLSCTKI